MRWPSLLAVSLFFLVVLPLPSAAAPKDWTLLVYLDADNDLEEVGVLDFLEMASVGSTDRVDVVVQFDRTPGYDSRYDDWTTAKRFHVTPGMVPSSANALDDLGEVNMADPATLVAFVTWGIANFPARYYFLVLWDHGNGWQGVVLDDDPVFGDRLTAVDLRTALRDIVTANGRRIDMVGNDACRMSLEIQYELVDFVDYFVGSEKDEPLDGWPYDVMLSSLVANPGMSPGELGAALVDGYVQSYENNSFYSVALSVVSATGLRPLVSRFNGLLDELAVHLPYFRDEVVAARDATENYELAGGSGGLEYDLYHFVQNLLDGIPSRQLERRGTEVLGALSNAVLYERHWDNPSAVNDVRAANAHGLSLWFPTGGGDPLYAQLALSQDSGWDEFLSSYATGQRPQVAANAAVTTGDSDGDSYLDEIVVQFAPAINGTMRLDVYRDGGYVLSRDYPAVAGRPEETRFLFFTGGFYEVTFYLFEGDVLVNLTVVADLVVHELIEFRGRVTGPGGTPVDGATVTLVHLDTGRTATTTANGGAYAIRVPYPTWFRDGDRLALRVSAGQVEARTEFDAILPPDRTFVQDVSLIGPDVVPWFVAVVVLGGLAAAGLAGTLYYRRRFERFKRIP